MSRHNSGLALMSLNKRLQFLCDTMKRNAGPEAESLFNTVLADRTRFATEDGAVVNCPAELPDRPLIDSCGESHTLCELAGGRSAVVLCFRGSWCPFSTTSMRAHEPIRARLADNGIAMFGITPQHHTTLATAIGRNALGFPLLTDSDQSLIDALGIRVRIEPELAEIYASMGFDVACLNESGDWALPLEATFLVAGDGRIEKAVAYPSPHRRMEPDAIVAHMTGSRADGAGA